MPSRIDRRPSLLPVQNQGERGTCLAFAVTAAHEMRRFVDVDVLEDLSEEVLYWGCRQVDGNDEYGTSFPSAGAALSRWGQPDEAFWPYDSARDETSSTYAPPTDALDPRHCHKTTLRSIPARWDEIRQALVNGYVVALGIRIGLGFFWTADGQIPLPVSEDELRDGHAVLIVGYEEDQTLIFRNSWGSRWGDQGYGYLPYAYLERFGAETWLIDVARTDLDGWEETGG